MDARLKNIDFEPLTEVKARLSEKVANVSEKNRILAVTLNGKPKVVVVSYEEFLRWVEQSSAESSLAPLKLSEWEAEAGQRREVVHSIKKMFDWPRLSRKGQKPYKKNALKKFGKT